MKKILFLLCAAVCAFAACDPTHEDIGNGGHITAEQLNSMSSVRNLMKNGRCVMRFIFLNSFIHDQSKSSLLIYTAILQMMFQLWPTIFTMLHLNHAKRIIPIITETWFIEANLNWILYLDLLKITHSFVSFVPIQKNLQLKFVKSLLV